jgi:hypothetical protein
VSRPAARLPFGAGRELFGVFRAAVGRAEQGASIFAAA